MCTEVERAPLFQERLAMLKQQQEEAAVKECTFQPVINHRSDRLMSERSEVLRVSHRLLRVRLDWVGVRVWGG